MEVDKLAEAVWRRADQSPMWPSADRLTNMYFDDVIEATNSILTARIEAINDPDSAEYAFGRPVLEDVWKSTREAYCLSLQSIWERSLRRFIAGAAPTRVEAIQMAKWAGLIEEFEDATGISMLDFGSFPCLDLLHYLGNAFRHGDGSSVNKLAEKYPFVFESPFEFPIPDLLSKPTVRYISIKMERLRWIKDNVVGFWDDCECIRLQSIRTKDEHISRLIEQLREKRAKLREVNASYYAQVGLQDWECTDSPSSPRQRL